MIFLRFWKLAILYILVMAKFISKCFSEIALLAAAVLWAGCNDVNKNSGNEKSASKTSSSSSAEILNPVEPTGSAALQNAEEKDDSLSNEPQKDSIDTNSNAAVLLDSAKQLEVKHARDSLMKAFFPVGKGNVDKDNVYAGLRCDIGNLLKRGSADRFNCFGNVGGRKIRLIPSGDVRFWDAPEAYGLISYPHIKDLVHPFSKTSELRVVGHVNAVKSKATAKVLFENIKSADNQTLNQDMYSRVAKVFRLKYPTLSHIYRMFLVGKPSNPFEGKITLMLTISADGTVKDALIISSTTGVKDFDENIINAVSQWTFSKVDSGQIVVYVPIRFLRQ